LFAFSSFANTRVCNDAVRACAGPIPAQGGPEMRRSLWLAVVLAVTPLAAILLAPASALASSGFFAGFVVSPPLAGLLADTAGFGGTWLLVTGAFLLATGCAAALQRLGHPTVAARAT